MGAVTCTAQSWLTGLRFEWNRTARSGLLGYSRASTEM
jgi:hypothetical protein